MLPWRGFCVYDDVAAAVTHAQAGKKRRLQTEPAPCSALMKILLKPGSLQATASDEAVVVRPRTGTAVGIAVGGVLLGALSLAAARLPFGEAFSALLKLITWSGAIVLALSGARDGEHSLPPKRVACLGDAARVRALAKRLVAPPSETG